MQKDAYLGAIKYRLARAKKTLETIQNLNFKQLTFRRASIEKETQFWKNCINHREWGPKSNCDEFGLPKKIDNKNNQLGCTTEDHFY